MIEKLSIIIPVYNEEKTIRNILDNLHSVELIKGIKKEIVIVNDCSSDDSEKVIKDFMIKNPLIEIKYFKHDRNNGKGAAIHTGIKQTTGDYVIIQDADLEYDPHEFNDLLIPIINGFADVVYGSRFTSGKPHRILFFWHSLGNKILTFFSNMFTNLNLTDMETCYKMINGNIIRSLELKEKRFGFEPEITAKLSRIPDLRMYEVGISYYGRTYSEGKKINWKDGIHAFYVIIKYGLKGKNT